MASVTLIIVPCIIFSVVNITNVIITCHIETPINYRTAVPYGSDFYLSRSFRKCTTVREQAKRHLMVVSGRSRGRGGAQHIASYTAANTTTSCVAGPLRAGGAEAEPELVFFGSVQNEESDAGIITYPMHQIRPEKCRYKILHHIYACEMLISECSQ